MKKLFFIALMGMVMACSSQVVVPVITPSDTLYVDIEPALQAAGYVTQGDLIPYVTESELDATLSNYITGIPSEYVTEVELNGTLGSYVTGAGMVQALADYATITQLNNAIAGVSVIVPQNVLTTDHLAGWFDFYLNDSVTQAINTTIVDSVRGNTVYYRKILDGGSETINPDPFLWSNWLLYINDSVQQYLPDGFQNLKYEEGLTEED